MPLMFKWGNAFAYCARKFRCRKLTWLNNSGSPSGAEIRERHESSRGGRLTKVANVLGVFVIKLLGQDEDKHVTRNGPGGSQSPLGLLTAPGALRLLRAYGQLKDGKQRRAIVTLVESILR
jgi:hypothetical protein